MFACNKVCEFLFDECLWVYNWYVLLLLLINNYSSTNLSNCINWNLEDIETLHQITWSLYYGIVYWLVLPVDSCSRCTCLEVWLWTRGWRICGFLLQSVSLPINHHGTVACKIGLIKTYPLLNAMRIKEKMNEQQNRSRVTHVEIIKNVVQDISTWRSLSTAQYLIRCHLFCFIKPITSRLDLTLYSAVDKDLWVEASCITFWIIATCVVQERFSCSKHTYILIDG